MRRQFRILAAIVALATSTLALPYAAHAGAVEDCNEDLSNPGLPAAVWTCSDAVMYHSDFTTQLPETDSLLSEEFTPNPEDVLALTQADVAAMPQRVYTQYQVGMKPSKPAMSFSLTVMAYTNVRLLATPNCTGVSGIATAGQTLSVDSLRNGHEIAGSNDAAPLTGCARWVKSMSQRTQNFLSYTPSAWASVHRGGTAAVKWTSPRGKVVRYQPVRVAHTCNFAFPIPAVFCHTLPNPEPAPATLGG